MAPGIAYVALKPGEPCRILVTTIPRGRNPRSRTLRHTSGPSHVPFLAAGYAVRLFFCLIRPLYELKKLAAFAENTIVASSTSIPAHG